MIMKKYFTVAILLAVYSASCVGNNTDSKVGAVKAKAGGDTTGSANRTEEAIARVVKFARAHKGKKVGDGECWAFADEAYKAAGIRQSDRPGIRVWGRVVNWKKEAVRPGDILELRGAVFPNFWTKTYHTAVIVSGGEGGKFKTLEQNIYGKRYVIGHQYDLSKLSKGSVTVYRFEYN